MALRELWMPLGQRRMTGGQGLPRLGGRLGRRRKRGEEPANEKDRRNRRRQP
jgi:hypothetical protein